jgi:saccharopine dehydrogenase-like NADP-dependent oxidoreductase
MTDKTVLLLGLGMQGRACLHDLVKNSDIARIIAVDIDPGMEEYLSCYPGERVTGRNIDVKNETDLISLMKSVDLVIEALPGEFALRMGRLAAESGVSLVSSMYFMNPGESDEDKIRSVKEELAEIDREAKEKGVSILTEFGLDPGIDLIMGARALSEMDEAIEFYSYGAGIPSPEHANNPLRYKFAWSAIDVMRAYSRPARVISGGKVKDIAGVEIFSKENVHTLDLKELDVHLECYMNGNGVRDAELLGIRDSIREMARYTCRLPGHCEFWETMVKCGFLNEEPLTVGDASVSPLRFTASLLDSQPQFHYAEDEIDVSLVRVDLRGKRKSEKKRVVYQLIDRRDFETGFTSMQRTVGFTMSLGAQLILEGVLDKKGLLTPLDVPYELVVRGLSRHGIEITRRQLPIES